MNERIALTDDLIERMLERRAMRVSAAHLIPEAQTAVAAAPQRWRRVGRLARWMPGLDARPAASAMTAVAAVILFAILGIGLLGGRGHTSVGGATPAPSPSVPSSPSPSGASGLTALPAGRLSAGSFWPSLTMTIPDGWVEDRGSDMFFGLVPDTDENIARMQAGGYPLAFLDVFRNLAVAAQDCSEAAAPDIGSTADDIARALAARPGLIASAPIPVTIGGLSGQQIDVALAPDWTGTCHQVDGPFVPLLYSNGFLWWGASPDERFRIIVLDVSPLPSGMFATVMVVIYSAQTESWADHLASSMAIVESFDFDVTR